MPDTDEDVVRELLTRSTADLFAAPAAAAAALRQQRQRRLRTRVLGVTGIAAAAGLAVGTLATGSGAAGPAARPAASSGGASAGASPAGTKAVQLTAAQRTLYGLSAAAAATQRPAGRYVVLTEKSFSGGVTGPKTSVIDTVTGGGVTYQDLTGSSYPQPPAVLNAPAGTSPTSTQLDAMPTGPAALRAFLLRQAKQQLAQAGQEMASQAAKAGKKIAKPVPATQPTDDDLVFEQAANLLWEPHLSPALRAAVYKVLADTPGVQVRTGVTDSAGRPAVEVSRVSTFYGEKVETFENPKTGATLESAWIEPTGELLEDLYLSISYTDHIPPDPYQG
jgi:hypothetical protein